MSDDSDFGIDSRYKTKKEKEKDSVALMQARLERMKNLTVEQILNAKLLQLKLKMDEYLKNPAYDNQNYFAQFLKFYVDIMYPKRSDFAKDINITPNFLSKIINSHRDPNEEFILTQILQ